MMTSLAALPKRSIPTAGGIAAAAAIVLILSGCASGAGPGTEAESTSAPTTSTAQPTAADDRIEANVIVLDARYDASAGTLEVSSIVNNHIGEGTCTITATSADGAEQRAEVEALPDAQSTVCPTTTLEGLGSGEWSVVVAFESDEAAGTSEPTTAVTPE